MPPYYGGLQHSPILPPYYGGLQHLPILPPYYGGLQFSPWRPTKFIFKMPAPILSRKTGEQFIGTENFQGCMTKVLLISRNNDFGPRQPAGLIENRILEIRELALERFFQHGPVDGCNLKQFQQLMQGLTGDGTRHVLRQKI